MELKKGLGCSADMDKEVQDLLHRDYPRGFKLNINAPCGVGSAISYCATKSGDSFFLGCKTHIDHGKYAGSFHVDPKSRLCVDLLFNDPACGLKLWWNTVYSRPPGNTVGFQWQSDHAKVGIEMCSREVERMNFSSVIGNKVLSVGTEVSFSSVDSEFFKCDIALRASHDNLISSLALKDKGDTANASFYHMKPIKNTTIGAELNHSISTKKTVLSVGAKSMLNDFIKLQASINNTGKAIVGLQHERQKRVSAFPLKWCGLVRVDHCYELY